MPKGGLRIPRKAPIKQEMLQQAPVGPTIATPVNTKLRRDQKPKTKEDRSKRF